MAVGCGGRSVCGTQFVGYGASAGSGEENSSTSVRRLRDAARMVVDRLPAQPQADAEAAARTIEVRRRHAGAGERRDRHRIDRSIWRAWGATERKDGWAPDARAEM
jgi:N-acetylglutamate synthase/N-acetylornithine aminotransferase